MLFQNSPHTYDLLQTRIIKSFLSKLVWNFLTTTVEMSLYLFCLSNTFPMISHIGHPAKWTNKWTFSSPFIRVYETLCAILYHFYNSKHVKNIHRGVLLLVKLQGCKVLWVLFMFFKLYEWCQIAQSITFCP